MPKLGFHHSEKTREKMRLSHMGENNPHWNNGIKNRSDGYIQIKTPGHPFRDEQDYVMEHRLVMEKKLGRYLTEKEVVHHIDGNRKNNKIKNLQLFTSNGEHLKLELTKNMSNRQCSVCESNKTIDIRGRPHWLHLDNRLVCRTCYNRHYRHMHKEQVKQYKRNDYLKRKKQTILSNYGVG